MIAFSDEPGQPALLDDAYRTASGKTISVPANAGWLVNDSSVEGGHLSVVDAKVTSGAGAGTLSWAPDGSFSFAPAAGFKGTVDVDYQVTDGLSHDFTDTTFIARQGGEFLVNVETGGDQVSPSVTALDSGGFLAAWMNQRDVSSALGLSRVKMHAFSAAGASLGDVFPLSSDAGAGEASVQVLGLKTGGFAAVWDESLSGTVRGQFFDADDKEVAQSFEIDGGSTHKPLLPRLDEIGDGRIVVTCQHLVDNSSDGSDADVMAVIVGPDGNLQGPTFTVNQSLAGDQWLPAVSALVSGGFAVAWFDRQDKDYRVRLFSGDGTALTDERTVPGTSGLLSGERPSLTPLKNGGFVLAWSAQVTGPNKVTHYAVQAQIFDAAGEKIGSVFGVDDVSTANQRQPVFASLANGGFIAAWRSWEPVNGDKDVPNIAAQVFDASGKKIGGVLTVNANLAGDQTNISVTGLKNGDFVISWQDYSRTLGDASGASIKAQIFHPVTPVTGHAHLVIENAAPVRSGDPAVLPTGRELQGFTLGKDVLLKGYGDPNGDRLEIGSLSVDHGTTAMKADGSYLISPASNFSGRLTINYAVSDGEGGRIETSLSTMILADKPPSDLVLSNATIMENSKGGSVIGLLSAVDPDDKDGFTYKIIKDGAAAFTVSGNQLLVRPGAVLDFEQNPSLSMILRVEDSTGRSLDKTLTIRLLDQSPLINGTSKADVLSGTDENDRIHGGAGNDTILGGKGDDRIYGEAGNDRLTGGSGSDLFHLEAAARNGRDTITDFTKRSDRLEFLAADYGWRSGHVLTAAELRNATTSAGKSKQFYFNKVDHTLYFDSDGAGGKAPSALAVLDKIVKLEASDFLFI